MSETKKRAETNSKKEAKSESREAVFDRKFLDLVGNSGLSRESLLIRLEIAKLILFEDVIRSLCNDKT